MHVAITLQTLQLPLSVVDILEALRTRGHSGRNYSDMYDPTVPLMPRSSRVQNDEWQ